MGPQPVPARLQQQGAARTLPQPGAEQAARRPGCAGRDGDGRCGGGGSCDVFWVQACPRGGAVRCTGGFPAARPTTALCGAPRRRGAGVRDRFVRVAAPLSCLRPLNARETSAAEVRDVAIQRGRTAAAQPGRHAQPAGAVQPDHVVRGLLLRRAGGRGAGLRAQRLAPGARARGPALAADIACALRVAGMVAGACGDGGEPVPCGRGRGGHQRLALPGPRAGAGGVRPGLPGAPARPPHGSADGHAGSEERLVGRLAARRHRHRGHGRPAPTHPMTSDASHFPPGNDPDIAAAHASELLDRRRITQARSLLGQALQQAPGHTGLLFELARAESLSDDWEATRQTLQSLLNQDPTHHPGRLMLMATELHDGRLPQAEEIVLGLLREAPREPVYYAYYSRVMLRALDFDKASRLADEALRLAPNLDFALHAKALCDIADGRGPQGDALARLLVLEPDDADALRLVLVALIHARRQREAYRLARQLLRAQPNDRQLLEITAALKAETHWSMWPLWPLQRWGWAGSIGLWLGMLLVSQALSRAAPQYSGVFSMAWIALVIYSWVWPSLFHRLVKPK
ncbi:MAG: tetratricopeptide repeat protein [Aquabacterium sp.]|nr:MAG: tetratricopeptide repeat protein [Aquabacterium sp.]